jgi:hypothetical protein
LVTPFFLSFFAQNGQSTGALSWALMQALQAIPNGTYVQILKETRRLLYGKYTQVPQLSVGFPIDLNIPLQL